MDRSQFTTKNYLPKKLLLLLAVFLVGILFLSFFFHSNYGAVLNANPEQANLALDAAIRSNNLNLCKSLQDVTIQDINYGDWCKDNILYNQALAASDPLLCDALNDSRRTQCVQDIFIAGAAQNDSGLEYCSDAPDTLLKQECELSYWTNKAVASGSSRACDNLSNRDDEAACTSRVVYDTFLKDPHGMSCSSLSPQYRTECVLLKDILENKNSKQCIVLHDQGMRGFCEQNLNQ